MSARCPVCPKADTAVRFMSTRPSYRRDCSCNGVDHPNGHGVGHADLVTDFRSSASTFVLRRSISFFAADPGPPPGGPAVLRHSFVIGFNEQMFGADEQVSGRWSERLRTVRLFQRMQSGQGRIASHPALLNLPRSSMAGAFSVHGFDKQISGLIEQDPDRGQCDLRSPAPAATRRSQNGDLGQRHAG